MTFRKPDLSLSNLPNQIQLPPWLTLKNLVYGESVFLIIKTFLTANTKIDKAISEGILQGVEKINGEGIEPFRAVVQLRLQSAQDDLSSRSMYTYISFALFAIISTILVRNGKNGGAFENGFLPGLEALWNQDNSIKSGE